MKLVKLMLQIIFLRLKTFIPYFVSAFVLSETFCQIVLTSTLLPQHTIFQFLCSSCSGCKEPLGMQNGLIPDAAISASTALSPGKAASKGRLNRDGCWTARSRNRHQWFLVDFGRTMNITQLATQGGGIVNQWVKMYDLYYRRNGSSRFTRYGSTKVYKMKRALDVLLSLI